MTQAADCKRWTSLTAMFFEQAANLADRPLTWAKHDKVYQPMTWGEIAERVRLTARGLRAVGVVDGDRVVLCAENRPEWLIADLAIMAAGGITVPAYTTNTTDDHRHILSDSGAKGAIVSKPSLFARLWPAALQVPGMRFTVAMESPDHPQAEQIEALTWQELQDRGADHPDDIDERLSAVRRDDVACLIYTSGTGGNPRGVMQTHGGVMHNCYGAHRLLERLGLSDREIFLSFLPLSHAYEHSAGQFFPLTLGAEIYYAESIDALSTNLREARPTIMTAVPRLYEALHQRISREVARQGGLKAKLFGATVALGRKRYERGRLGLMDRLADMALDRLVRRKVRARFGGRLKAMVSGGAPLNVEIGLFFHGLGLPILQGYGQTEASPVISCNVPGEVRMETVGPPLADVGVRIAEDGEILVRGELVMKGYWNNAEATAAALRDGWLHTGDIGHTTGNGSLVITDRKKDIIVNSGGDNLSPQRVEGFLTLEPEIAQAMVVGDRRPYLVALLVADQEFATEWAGVHEREPKMDLLAEDAEFRKTIAAAVDRVNHTLSPIERVRHFIISAEPFTVDNGRMTPTMKIRRHAIMAVYGDRLEALYGRGENRSAGGGRQRPHGTGA